MGLGLAYGIITLAAGVAVLVWPSETLLVIAVLLHPADRVRDIQVRGRAGGRRPIGRERVLLALLAVVSIIVGLWAVRHVDLTLLVLAALLGIFWVVNGCTDFAKLRDADLIVEAVFEDMAVKSDVFVQLDKIAKPGAILASNTSALDIDAIAAVTSRPQDVIGLHFFSPAHVMRLLEIVRGAKTEPSVLATAVTLARAIGKVGVVVGVCDGFCANRMLYPYLRQADCLMEEGALPQDIDRALTAFGFAMGPCAMLDMAGQDVAHFVRQRQLKTWPANMRYSRLADILCERRRFGSKSGAGWYQYPSGPRSAQPDPDVEAMIVEESPPRHHAASDFR